MYRRSAERRHVRLGFDFSIRRVLEIAQAIEAQKALEADRDADRVAEAQMALEAEKEKQENQRESLWQPRRYYRATRPEA